MGKRIPQLDTGTPTISSYLPYYDPSTDETLAAQLDDVGHLDELFKILIADDTGGQNVNTAQPWLPTTGAVSVEASTTYAFEGVLRLSRSAGTTSHTTGLLFGGTATLTSIIYEALVNTGDVVTTGTPALTVIEVSTNTSVKAASTSATEQTYIRVRGIIRVNAAGTLIPQFQYSAAPGGAPTVKSGSHFRLKKLFEASSNTQGTWA